MKTRMLCPGCGSADVTRDGLLRWNGEAWEMSGELDSMQCENCGEEVSEFDVIPEVTMPERAPANQIKIRVYNVLPEDMWLSEFFVANANGIDAAERGEIIEALVNAGTYFGGGGAEPEWRLWVIGVEAPAA